MMLSKRDQQPCWKLFAKNLLQNAFDDRYFFTGKIFQQPEKKIGEFMFCY